MRGNGAHGEAFAGGVCRRHLSRDGNQGQRIGADDKARPMWVATLVQAWQRTGGRIHAGVRLAHPYHLLLETPEPSLVGGMQWLPARTPGATMPGTANAGTFFRAACRAVPVAAEAQDYFQTVSTYIHLNPARAKLIRIGEEKLWEYPWSSYPCY